MEASQGLQVESRELAILGGDYYFPPRKRCLLSRVLEEVWHFGNCDVEEHCLEE